MHQDTKFQIIDDDAIDLDETMQQDWLRVVLRHTWPEHKDMPFRLVPNFNEPNVDSMMGAIKMFVDMGGKVRVEDGRSLLGVPAPMEGEEVLQRQEIPQIGGPGDMGGDPFAGLGQPSPDEQAAMDELFGGLDEPEEPDAEAEQFAKRGSMKRYAFDPQKHPHKSKGPGGGQFAPKGGGGSGGSSGESASAESSAPGAGGKAKAGSGGIGQQGQKFAQAYGAALQSGDQAKIEQTRQKASAAWKQTLASQYVSMKQKAVAEHGEAILETPAWQDFKNTIRGFGERFDDGLAQGDVDALSADAASMAGEMKHAHKQLTEQIPKEVGGEQLKPIAASPEPPKPIAPEEAAKVPQEPKADESIEATPSQMLRAAQESQRTGKDPSEVVSKYQHVLSD